MSSIASIDLPTPSWDLTEMAPIKIKYRPGAAHLEMTSYGDWCDLFVNETFTLQPGEFKLVDLGVAMKLPKGYEANIVMRSSTFKRYGLLQTNAYAVIDESYCGNDDWWMLPVYATRPVTIERGTRLCQFRINKKQPLLQFEEVEYLEDENRNGFGHSGV